MGVVEKRLKVMSDKEIATLFRDIKYFKNNDAVIYAGSNMEQFMLECYEEAEKDVPIVLPMMMEICDRWARENVIPRKNVTPVETCVKKPLRIKKLKK